MWLPCPTPKFSPKVGTTRHVYHLTTYLDWQQFFFRDIQFNRVYHTAKQYVYSILHERNFLGESGWGGSDSQISNQAMQKFVYMYHTIYTYEVV